MVNEVCSLPSVLFSKLSHDYYVRVGASLINTLLPSYIGKNYAERIRIYVLLE